MAKITIVIETTRPASEIVKDGQTKENIQRLQSLLKSVGTGNVVGSVTITTDEVKPIAAKNEEVVYEFASSEELAAAAEEKTTKRTKKS